MLKKRFILTFKEKFLSLRPDSHGLKIFFFASLLIDNVYAAVLVDAPPAEKISIVTINANKPLAQHLSLCEQDYIKSHYPEITRKIKNLNLLSPREKASFFCIILDKKKKEQVEYRALKQIFRFCAETYMIVNFGFWGFGAWLGWRCLNEWWY